MNQKKAEADLAYDLQKYKTGQLVKAEEVQVNIIEKQKQIELQQQEIMRKQRELEANVQKPADAERYKVETLANARKFQLETEAAGAASATKATGFAAADVVKATGIAEAEANKARGLAEAAVIEAQGKATAEAMRVKAESFKQYNEAAVVEMIIRVLPEVAGKISEPLSKTEKMVIINSGNGVGGGASKLTGDVTQIMAQLPPVIESLTGIKFEKLLEQVPGLKKAMEKTRSRGQEDKRGTMLATFNAWAEWETMLDCWPAVMAPLALRCFVFWIWMLIHAITEQGPDAIPRRSSGSSWSCSCMFLGALIYFFVGRPKARAQRPTDVCIACDSCACSKPS